jgi:hypothetical protein
VALFWNANFGTQAGMSANFDRQLLGDICEQRSELYGIDSFETVPETVILHYDLKHMNVLKICSKIRLFGRSIAPDQ